MVCLVQNHKPVHARIGVLNTGVEKHIVNTWFTFQLNNLHLLEDLTQGVATVADPVGQLRRRQFSSNLSFQCQSTSIYGGNVNQCSSEGLFLVCLRERYNFIWWLKAGCVWQFIAEAKKS